MARVTTRVTRKSRQAAVLRDYEASLTALVGRAANLVRNTAVESINQGAKTGVVYTRGGKTSQRSAAGEPPATDTGFLVNNIVLDIDVNGLGANVESRADYSAFLEFGTSKMAARPFMQPALEANRAKIRRLEQQMVKAK